MMEESDAWNRLMAMLSDAIIEYLSMQIDAGAQAIQLFDSWIGCLSPAEYRRYVLPHVQRIFLALKSRNVPRIHFGMDTGAMLKDFSNVDCEVIGVDWRIDIADAKAAIGTKAVQGNMDPVVLLGDIKAIEIAADEIIAAISAKQGFIFNLGHGMLPESDDRKVKHLVDYLHGK
jgi:uroporphyrinogen decarboxylase